MQGPVERRRRLLKYAERPLTDAMDDWAARGWTLEALDRDFGSCEMTLQTPLLETRPTSTFGALAREIRACERLPARLRRPGGTHLSQHGLAPSSGASSYGEGLLATAGV